jgi:predicted ATPase
VFLEIENIGKIQKASVEIRGITVIAGNNNTGKSTYGKILYCMFNAFYNAESTIQKERKDSLKYIIRSFQGISHVKSLRYIVDNITEHQLSFEEISSLLKELIDNKNIITNNINIDNDIDSMAERIIRSRDVTDKQIQKIILTRFLRSEFRDRIIHVNHAEEKGAISLKIKGNTLSASIENNECTGFSDEVKIICDALYIDTPFIMDEMDSSTFFRGNGHRARLIRSLSRSPDDIGAIDEILTKQQMQRILSNIRTVVNGEFKQNEDEWVFQEEGLEKPLGMFNISTGMKPFMIIKRLLEAGEIKDQGVLILDEPEIHLHPDWQLKYAELLVLLQKEFNLNILLTTHSPYFLNAIEVYSKINNISTRCNYYLTDVQGDVCSIREVTNNLDLVYRKLAIPFQELENLRYREN